MSNIVIKVENISKQYRLGDVGSGSMRDDFKRFRFKLMGKDDPFARIGEENIRNKQSNSDYVWALKDINFELGKGEILGIVGNNGAGKSTLLKILSRTTGPTTGSIKMKGRIASLLEVGTGFHGELSGRENIYLNGSILGLRKYEITKKLDEIIEFAGVERYLDTPVKRYSSGMYIRLAFGVAAHLESDILIVDEVLAVGDAEFQKKCLGKMKDASHKEGRTVLFVSHNLAAVNQLCTSGILLNNGTINSLGKTSVANIIDAYLKSSQPSISIVDRSDAAIHGNHFSLLRLSDNNGNFKSDFQFNQEINIHVKINLPDYNEYLELAIRIEDKNRVPVFTIHESLCKFYDESSITSLIITIPKKFLTPGFYSMVVCINYPGVTNYDLLENILPFSLLDTGSEFSRYENLNYGSVFAQYSITKNDQ